MSNDNNLPKPLPWEEIAVKMELFIHGKVRGDIDNYAKSILDSFQRAGVIDNDKKVTFLQARIIEAPKDRERVLVTFEKVGGSYE